MVNKNLLEILLFVFIFTFLLVKSTNEFNPTFKIEIDNPQENKNSFFFVFEVVFEKDPLLIFQGQSPVDTSKYYFVYTLILKFSVDSDNDNDSSKGNFITCSTNTYKMHLYNALCSHKNHICPPSQFSLDNFLLKKIESSCKSNSNLKINLSFNYEIAQEDNQIILEKLVDIVNDTQVNRQETSKRRKSIEENSSSSKTNPNVFFVIRNFEGPKGTEKAHFLLECGNSKSWLKIKKCHWKFFNTEKFRIDKDVFEFLEQKALKTARKSAATPLAKTMPMKNVDFFGDEEEPETSLPNIPEEDNFGHDEENRKNEEESQHDQTEASVVISAQNSEAATEETLDEITLDQKTDSGVTSGDDLSRVETDTTEEGEESKEISGLNSFLEDKNGKDLQGNADEKEKLGRQTGGGRKKGPKIPDDSKQNKKDGCEQKYDKTFWILIGIGIGSFLFVFSGVFTIRILSQKKKVQSESPSICLVPHSVNV